MRHSDYIPGSGVGESCGYDLDDNGLRIMFFGPIFAFLIWLAWYAG